MSWPPRLLFTTVVKRFKCDDYGVELLRFSWVGDYVVRWWDADKWQGNPQWTASHMRWDEADQFYEEKLRERAIKAALKALNTD